MREFPAFRLDAVNQCLWRGYGINAYSRLKHGFESRLALDDGCVVEVHYTRVIAQEFGRALERRYHRVGANLSRRHLVLRLRVGSETRMTDQSTLRRLPA